MTRMRTMTIAMTSRMWMKPPIVYDVTMPRSHRTRRMTKMVQSMFLPPFSWIEQLPCRARNGSSSSAASAGVERNAAPRDVLCKSDKKRANLEKAAGLATASARRRGRNPPAVRETFLGRGDGSGDRIAFAGRQGVQKPRLDPDAAHEERPRLLTAAESHRRAAEIQIAFGALLEPDRTRIERVRKPALAPQRLRRAPCEKRRGGARPKGDGAREARIRRREKLGLLGYDFLGGRSRFAQKSLTFRLGKCRERSHGRESDEEKGERREQGTTATRGNIGPLFVASDAPKRQAREKGGGPGGDGDPEREVGEREQCDG